MRGSAHASTYTHLNLYECVHTYRGMFKTNKIPTKAERKRKEKKNKKIVSKF